MKIAILDCGTLGYDIDLSPLRALSFSFTSLFCFLSLYFLLKLGEGYWIFAVFFVSMLKQLDKWLKNAKSLN